MLDFLVEQGYEVFRVRDTTGTDAPDSVIAFVANAEGLVLITHDKHPGLAPPGCRRLVPQRPRDSMFGTTLTRRASARLRS